MIGIGVASILWLLLPFGTHYVSVGSTYAAHCKDEQKDEHEKNPPFHTKLL